VFVSVTVILIVSLLTVAAEVSSVKETTGAVVSIVILDIGAVGSVNPVIALLY
jgi:hypothetical protein